MVNKIGLFIAATIAVGMFALPATMAYFDGQHTFVDGADVDCEKCHTTIGEEFASTQSHDAMACRDCHVTTLMGGTSGYQNNASKVGHASTAVECMDCHNSLQSSAPQAGPEGDHDITNTSAAHNAWYLSALDNEDTTLKNGANEVCVACHTHTAVTIIWLPGTNMTYNQSSDTFSNSADAGRTLNATV
ncbi:MAG: hypothetical protein E4G94_06025 [ANME-2 cluster archaeon]|nr:MAG: hypothetical protein E4G94_06025 [ANME-2 cluster archaeon]